MYTRMSKRSRSLSLNSQNAATTSKLPRQAPKIDGVTDEMLLKGDLDDLLRTTKAKCVLGNGDLKIYQWRYRSVTGTYSENNVEMDEEKVLGAHEGRLCTTGAATCVVIVVRGYDASGKLVLNYVRHDSMYTTTDADDKKETLKEAVGSVLDWSEAHRTTKRIAKLDMVVVGGQPDGSSNALDTERAEEADDIRTFLLEDLGVHLVYYNTEQNKAGNGNTNDGSSLSVVCAEDRVCVILDAPSRK
jgi:hypothetical protein